MSKEHKVMEMQAKKLEFYSIYLTSACAIITSEPRFKSGFVVKIFKLSYFSFPFRKII